MFFILSLLVYGLWSTIFPLGKIALEQSPPLFLTGSRMIIAGFILLGYLLIRNRPALRLTFKQFLSICLLSLFSVYLSNAFEYWGLQSLSAAKTCFIYSMAPFLSALFSYLHFGEKMSPRKWVGMLIGFAGIFPVLYAQKGGEELLTSIPFLSWPELSVMAAAACAAYGWILLRVAVKTSEIPTTMANGSSMMIGGIFALMHSFFAESWAPFPVSEGHWGTFGFYLFLLIFISNLLCYNIYGFLLKRYTATLLSFAGLFSPILASLSSWAILGETPSLTILLSTGVLLCGLWMVYSAELKQGYLATKQATA